jgi:hypothetical protein
MILSMYMIITPMRVRSKALDQNEIRSADSVSGNVVTASENVAALGRYSTVASVKTGAGSMDDALPPLYDARLIAMGANGFTLSGIELEGATAYAQSCGATSPKAVPLTGLYPLVVTPRSVPYASPRTLFCGTEANDLCIDCPAPRARNSSFSPCFELG